MVVRNFGPAMKLQNYLLVTILLFPFTATEASAGDPICPTYKDGQFWIFRAKQVNGMMSTSNLLDGKYKVIYKMDHVEVKGYPYADNVLVLLFQCAHGTGLVRTNLAEGMAWPNEYTLRTMGKDLVVKTITKVVGVTTLQSGDEVFKLHRKSTFMISPRPYEADVDYLFSPKLNTIVEYDLNSEDRPLTMKVTLIGIGSEDSGGIQFVDVNGKLDDATKQRVLAQYGNR